MPIESRSEYIGGSDAAALVGKHDFKSPKDVYRKLRQGEDYEPEDLSENRHIMRGNACEPHALARIKEEYPGLNQEEVRSEFDRGSPVSDEIFLQHPELDYVAGHTDGLVMDPLDGTVIVHEVKTPTSSSIKWMEKNGVSDRYLYQIQHYMGIIDAQTNLDVEGRLQIWSCDEWDVWTTPIDFKPRLFSRLMNVYEYAWTAAKKEEKPFEETKLTQYTSDVAAEGTYSSDRMDKLLAEYYGVHSQFKEAKERKKRLKSKILSQLDEEERIEGDGYYAKIRNYSNSTHLIVREK